jgi:hypothetical protein
MNAHRRFITEPGEERWLYASPRTAATGAAVVALLVAAMILFGPGKRPDAAADGSAPSAASIASNTSTSSPAPVAAPEPASSSRLPPLDASNDVSPKPRTSASGHRQQPR